MKKTVVIPLFATGLIASTAAQALTIDTNPTWDGTISEGWFYSAQSLTVDAAENWLDDINFYFDPDSTGRVFNFRIADELTGGTTFYQTSFSVVSGINTFAVDLAFAPGSTIYAVFDYNGFDGKTVDVSNVEGYAGGESFFGSSDGSWSVPTIAVDHRFIANFSDGDTGPSNIPLPATLPLVLGGFGLMALARRRKA